MESKEIKLKNKVKEELHKLEDEILAMDPGAAMKVIEGFYPAIEKEKKLKIAAKEYFETGIRKMNARKFSSASSYFENAIGLRIKNRDSKGTANALEMQVRCLLNIDNASKELTCSKAKTAKKIYEEIGGREGYRRIG